MNTFPDRPMLGNGMMMSGTSIGGMVMPFLITFFMREYGTQGGMIIMAGLWMNLAVTSIVLGDGSCFKKSRSEEHPETPTIWRYGAIATYTPTPRKQTQNYGGTVPTLNWAATPRPQPNDVAGVENKPSIQPNSISKGPIPAPVASDVIISDEDAPTHSAMKHTLPTQDLVCTPEVISSSSNMKTLLIPSNNTRFTAENPARSPTTREHEENELTEANYCQHFLALAKPLLTFKFVTVILFVYLINCSAMGLIQYFPAYAQEHGMSSVELSTLMSIVSVCDLISRLLLALLGDHERVDKDLLMFWISLLGGLFTIGLPFHPNKQTLYVYSVMFGLTGDVSCVFLGTQVQENVDKRYVAAGLGLTVAAIGAGSMTISAALGGCRIHNIISV